jgi:small subunit ribosomal protein S16
MAVKLRLTRIGTTKRPFYRLIATPSKAPRNGRNLEVLGTYDPMNMGVRKGSSQAQAKGLTILKTDRILYWLSVGAQPTDTVKTMLKRAKISLSSKASSAA